MLFHHPLCHIVITYYTDVERCKFLNTMYAGVLLDSVPYCTLLFDIDTFSNHFAYFLPYVPFHIFSTDYFCTIFTILGI